MSQATILLVVVMAGAGVFLGLGFIALRMIRAAGASDEAAEEAKRDKEALRKQTEIMMQDRTSDETADRLDRGGF